MIDYVRCVQERDLHRRERWAEQIGKLCRGRYMPVEVITVDNHGKGICFGLVMGIHLHNNVVTELEFGTLEPEVLCCAYCRSRGTENVSGLKKSTSSFSRRGAVSR